MAKRNASWIWMIWIAALLMLTGCSNKTPKESFSYASSLRLRAGVLALAFSPDGKTLAAGHGRRYNRGADIRLWDVKTGAEKATLKGHHDRIETLAFSPDGKTLASGAADRTARLWSAETGESIQTFNTTTSAKHPAWIILSVAFADSGKKLAAIDNVGGINVWNLNTPSPVGKLIQFAPYGVSAVSVSPNGQQIAADKFRGGVRLIDMKTGEETRAMKGHSHSIHALAYSADSKTLASGSIDSSILLWNAYTGKRLKRLKGHESSVLCLAFSPDGKTLASGCISQEKQTLDRLKEQGKLPEYLTQKRRGGLSGETLRLWDVKTGDHLKTLNGHEGAVWSVAFSPDSKTLASGGSDRTVRLWDVKTGKLIRALK